MLSVLLCQHGFHCIYSPYLFFSVAIVRLFEIKYSFVDLLLMNLLGKASKHIGGVISYNSLFVISSIIFQNNSSCDTACGVEMSSS